MGFIPAPHPFALRLNPEVSFGSEAMRGLKACLCISLFLPLLSLAISTVPAQEQTLRTQTNLVFVPALVKDAKGKVVYGLQQKDFMIEDDGVQQAVKLDEEPESDPVALVIAIQRGRRARKEYARIRTLHTMLNPIASQRSTEMAVVEFDSRVELIRNFTNNLDWIQSDVETLQEGDNGAAIRDAVSYSVKLLEGMPKTRRRVLLLISETRDHGSKTATIGDVVTAIGSSNTVVYALAYSPAISEIHDTLNGKNNDEEANAIRIDPVIAIAWNLMKKNTPKEIAAMTGGEYELFQTNRHFQKMMMDFDNNLHSRYLLSFQPSQPRPGLHRIHVRLSNPRGETILARTSYWAPGPVH